MSLPNFFCGCYSPCACQTDFDPEFQQAQEKQPQFMLECSKIIGAKYMRKVSKKEFPDISRDGFLYSVNDIFFVLDEGSGFLLGVFVDSEMKRRKFQDEFDEIKKKSAAFIEQNKKFELANRCFIHQQIVQSYLTQESEDFKRSSELLESFNLQCNNLKESKESLKKEIEQLILNNITQELATLPQKACAKNVGANGINISANVNHSLEYFLSIK
jgi:hypothetical protein